MQTQNGDTLMASSAARTDRPGRPFLVPFILALLALLVVGGLLLQRVLGDDGVESHDTQVVHSLTREEQVVLLTLGIQGIRETRTEEARLFGLDQLRIPWSDRASFIQYEYKSKVGFEGGEVEIEQIGEKRYRITVPEFEFIGTSDPQLQVAVEDNGVLSWTTPPIDQLEVANEILNDEVKDEQIAENEDILRDQAESFYNGILQGIDPELTAEYVFR